MDRNYIIEENRIYLPNENGKILAEITFEKINDETYNISHTFVDESLRGQGIAGQLVGNAVEYIKLKGYEVSATCSYAMKRLQEHAK